MGLSSGVHLISSVSVPSANLHCSDPGEVLPATPVEEQPKMVYPEKDTGSKLIPLHFHKKNLNTIMPTYGPRRFLYTSIKN